MNTLKINNLRLSTYIGCQEWEQKQRQTVLINLTFSDTKEVRQDNPQYYIEYISLTKKIINEFESRHHNLIETLAKQISDFIANNFEYKLKSISITKERVVSWVDSVTFTINHDYVD